MYTLALPKLHSSFHWPSLLILNTKLIPCSSFSCVQWKSKFDKSCDRVTRLYGSSTNYVIVSTIPILSLFQAKEQLPVRIVGKVFNNWDINFWFQILSCTWYILYVRTQVRDDPKLLVDSGEVPISKWSDWWFHSRYEIFSLLDGKN